MTVGYVFTGICPFTFEGGTPSQVWRGVPHPVFDGGGTLSQVWTGWVPNPRSGLGGTLSQIWMGVPPSKIRMRYPTHQRLDGVPPPSRTGWGTPHPRLDEATSPIPPPPTVRRQISKASTCYAAGGMPLAFTQEDFLVR